MDEYRDEKYSEYAYGHELYFGVEEPYFKWKEIELPEDVSKWINSNIKYIEDEYEEFSNPEKVLKRGYGDCDDFAILVVNILYVRFGIKADLVLLDSYTNEVKYKTIINGGVVNHAAVRYNGVVYDVYDLRRIYVNPIIGYLYPFEHVFTRI